MEEIGQDERIMKNYLSSVDPINNKLTWSLQISNLSGRGIFATDDLPAGVIVFIDYPLILGPRASITSTPMCVSCYKINIDLVVCSKGCGLPVCSIDCENSPVHSSECCIIRKWCEKSKRKLFTEWSHELLRSLSAIRSVALSPDHLLVLRHLQGNMGKQHGFEVEFLKQLGLVPDDAELDVIHKACCVLDTNAFETTFKQGSSSVSLRGLYPVGSLMNHNCVPNTTHTFTYNQKMVVKTTKFIPKGTEITTSYTHLLWGTPARRHNLHKTKHFWCKCTRCTDRTEFGTCLSALYCPEKDCTGTVLPRDPLNIQSKWICGDCKKDVSQKKIGMIQITLGSLMGTFYKEDAMEVVEFFKERLPNVIPVSNQLAVELKYRIVWILGYTEGYFWNELSDDLLRFKETMCRDMLDTVNALQLGDCKIKGLLLQDLHFCLEEREHRHLSLRDCSNGLEDIKTESIQARSDSLRILGDDVNVVIKD